MSPTRYPMFIAAPWLLMIAGAVRHGNLLGDYLSTAFSTSNVARPPGPILMNALDSRVSEDMNAGCNAATRSGSRLYVARFRGNDWAETEAGKGKEETTAYREDTKRKAICFNISESSR